MRQRAGPLVKECRALRPRFKKPETAEDEKKKNRLRREQNGTFERKQVDRLELMLALMGRNGWHYTLTFDSEHLPGDFRGVRRELQSFFRRCKRWRESRGESAAFDYIYCIEGLHGDRRYHVHLILDYYQIGPSEVEYLWRRGMVNPGDEPGPVLLKHGGFRRMAEYLNKERTDGFVIPIGRHPWSASKSLRDKLPKPEKWTDDSGVIDVPDDAVWVSRGSTENDFGAYYYASWIESRARTTYQDRAHARGNNLVI